MKYVTHVRPQLPRTVPCKIAFVGESPSDEERMKDAPLVGPSGRVFNAALRTAGLERDDYLITNVFDEQADGNDFSEWMEDEAFCTTSFKRLAAELEAAKPTVIVPLGGTALWAFTGRKDIMAHRGSAMLATAVSPGAKLVPALHPAAIMHQWKFLPVLVGDLLKAAREADDGPELVLPHRRLLIEPQLNDVHDYCEECLSSELLSVDIETGWGQITCIGLAPNEEEAMCIPFTDIRKPTRNYWGSTDTEYRAWGYIKALLESDVPKVGQNYATYDAFWLLEMMGIYTRNLLHDCRLIHHALYPELPKDLAFMGNSYTRQGVWKTWGHKAQEKRDS